MFRAIARTHLGVVPVLLAGGLAVFLVATPFMLAAILPLAPNQGAVTPPQTPAPRLQTDPAADAATLRRKAR